MPDEHLLQISKNRVGKILEVTPEFIFKNFPQTNSESLVYDSNLVPHPLVGFEQMLVPLENYYEFLAGQSFSEFISILVQLGVKKIELIQSHNELMKKSLEAYATIKGVQGIGGYREETETKARMYWGMEFTGKDVQAQEISSDFLKKFPFHANNGTLLAMLEGIRSGNRNKTYTVKRSFTGTYGLNVELAMEILGRKIAGFDFSRKKYEDEKSTFSVVY